MQQHLIRTNINLRNIINGNLNHSGSSALTGKLVLRHRHNLVSWEPITVLLDNRHLSVLNWVVMVCRDLISFKDLS